LDFRVGREEPEGTHWRILADVSITIVLMMVVFLVVQFMTTFRERYVLQSLAARQRSLRASLYASGDSNSFQIDSIAPDRQRITFKSELLFETCRADLKPEGKRVLSLVGSVLQAHRDDLEAVEVEGHTDVVPIAELGRCPYPSNWELSSARATSVVTLLSASNLVDNTKLSAVGRAEYHPVDRIFLAPNRRIELLLQYDRVPVEKAMLTSGAAHPASR